MSEMNLTESSNDCSNDSRKLKNSKLLNRQEHIVYNYSEIKVIIFIFYSSS